ncbi:MAG: phosphatidate cytidylyltransferase [Flavobacteriales bacterium]|jgi:phosphatidate cytidylyltransferase|uniref:phosphatidate cytidylyltransferase n=1 Tax=Blattabacterium sp. (Mastotermes darwiniensis) TaxID=39768 RepID=UPI000231DE80|nr:phosphatidate cytidylyltransferase [Blattabacterium sp. (Mastotermes darwiniensis)]AER40692.1 phosphatidate cytidylyltransferase [Blattabacterium sp. (Mastotermes darwiniensis) str. MADAR]MDR1804780.1 phosphatidate cytidylyltransferase [Flavobacteriales bacterium]
MKKKKLDFFIRLFTGFIYILLIVLSIEKGEKIFRIVMMILSFFCLFEFLVISKTKTFLIKIVSSFFLFSIFIDFFMEKGLILYIVCFIPYSITFFTIQLFSRKYSHKEKIAQVSHLIFGLIYIIMPFYLASYIYTIHGGKKLILGTFILIWTNDTLSYLIGKKWGKRKIAISISPKKSVEGFLGGLFFCLILGIYLSKIWEKYWVILSFTVPIFATIGDLVESTIKRSYSVKNSGIWFPGHGGFLDRLDSFIFVIPIIATVSVFFLNK